MNEKVLLVDDDERVLSALKRRLYKKFKINTANSGHEALGILDQDDTYAVVVSDQQMPEMDGITFLKTLKEKKPDAIRIMLTGNADQQTAVSSINESKVFRYLNKPCTVEELSEAISEGLVHHRIEIAERELLEQTLAGSVKLLTDILAINDPDTFKQVSIMRIAARQLAKYMKHPKAWELDLTVMLSNIGDVVLPLDLRAKAASGEPLSDAERAMFAGAPGVARDLLMNIPRLKPVAEAIYYKDKSFNGKGFPEEKIEGSDLPLNARILHLLEHLLDISSGHPPTKEHFEKLLRIGSQFDPELMSLCQKYFLDQEIDYSRLPGETELEVKISELQPGDRLLENLVTENGKLALAADNVFTDALLKQTQQFHMIRKLQEPIRILRKEEELILLAAKAAEH